MRCFCWTVAVVVMAVTSASCNMMITKSANRATNKDAEASGVMMVSTPFASVPSPADVAVDAAGDLLVVSMYNHSVYRCRRDGTMLQLAGNGSAGFANGNASVSMVNSPRGIACDNEANIAYITDFENNCVRKLNLSNSDLTTLAGSTTSGYVDGNSSVAKFYWPVGITLYLSSQILYVADTRNDKIRKIFATNGSVLTLWCSCSQCGYICATHSGAFWGSSSDTISHAHFSGGCVTDPHNIANLTGLAGVAISHDSSSPILAVVSNEAQTVTLLNTSSLFGWISTASPLFVAGNGSVGFTDGPLRNATFRYPVRCNVVLQCNKSFLWCTGGKRCQRRDTICGADWLYPNLHNFHQHSHQPGTSCEGWRVVPLHMHIGRLGWDSRRNRCQNR